jgi:hypothetical protein
MSARKCKLALLALLAVLSGCAWQLGPPIASSGVTSPVRAADSESPLTAVAGERRSGDPAAGSAPVSAVPGVAVPAYLPGQLVVGLSGDAPPPLDLGALGKATLKDELRFTRRYALLQLPESTDLDAAARDLSSRPGVVSVSRNYRAVRRSAPTNDPLLGAHWAYEPKVADVYGAWSILDQQPVGRFTDTVVAVVDGGVDPAHPDVNALPGFNSSAALVSGQNVSTVGWSDSGDDHGLACAGIVGAKKNNGIGAAGVAPNVPILPIMVDDPNGAPQGDFSTLRGLMLAGYYNRPDSPYPNVKGSGGKVRVINLSLGPSIVGRMEAYDSAIEFLRQRGIVVIVAAGNNGLDGRVEVPANSPAAVGVAASMQYLGFELLAPYSSHGPEIWVTGPGNFLWAPAARGSASNYDNAYQLFNGTSSAAPFVAGIAAAINIVYGSGGADQDTAAWADKVKRRLADTAEDLGSPGFDGVWGHGRVNARRAITGSL